MHIWAALRCPFCLCRQLRCAAQGSHHHCLGCSAGSTWDDSWDRWLEVFARRAHPVPVCTWSSLWRPSQCFSFQEGITQRPKRMLCPHNRGANPAPSVLPLCEHLGTGLQGGHPQLESKPWLCVSHSRVGTALIVSTLAFLVDGLKEFFLQKTSLILPLIFSCENNPAALCSTQTHKCLCLLPRH